MADTANSADGAPCNPTYTALKRAGHSPAKAAEIMLDAKRGCEHARRWIGIIHPSHTEGAA